MDSIGSLVERIYGTAESILHYEVVDGPFLLRSSIQLRLEARRLARMLVDKRDHKPDTQGIILHHLRMMEWCQMISAAATLARAATLKVPSDPSAPDEAEVYELVERRRADTSLQKKAEIQVDSSLLVADYAEKTRFFEEVMNRLAEDE